MAQIVVILGPSVVRADKYRPAASRVPVGLARSLPQSAGTGVPPGVAQIVIGFGWRRLLDGAGRSQESYRTGAPPAWRGPDKAAPMSAIPSMPCLRRPELSFALSNSNASASFVDTASGFVACFVLVRRLPKRPFGTRSTFRTNRDFRRRTTFSRHLGHCATHGALPFGRGVTPYNLRRGLCSFPQTLLS